MSPNIKWCHQLKHRHPTQTAVILKVCDFFEFMTNLSS